MALTTTCDYCGEPIEPKETININVMDRSWHGEAIPGFYRSIDLHRDCYVEHYARIINQKKGQT